MPGRKPKPIVMIDLQTQKVIDEFESISNAALHTNISRANISDILKGKNSIGDSRHGTKNKITFRYKSDFLQITTSKSKTCKCGVHLAQDTVQCPLCYRIQFVPENPSDVGHWLHISKKDLEHAESVLRLTHWKKKKSEMRSRIKIIHDNIKLLGS